MHEAYIRLVGANEVQHWDSCRHFFAAAAEAMRRILIERARKRSAKCGGMVSRDDVDIDRLCTRMTSEELIDLDAALNELVQDHPEKARLVTLRYFGGFNVEQCCEILQISRATAHRYWGFARAWLLLRMTEGAPSSESQNLKNDGQA